MEYDVEMIIAAFMLDPAVAEVLRNQQAEIERLQKANSDMGWRLNPDRMGGSFSEWETNRRGDEWS